MANTPNDPKAGNSHKPNDKKSPKPGDDKELPDTEPMTHLPQPPSDVIFLSNPESGGPGSSGQIPIAEPFSDTGISPAAHDPGSSGQIPIAEPFSDTGISPAAHDPGSSGQIPIAEPFSDTGISPAAYDPDAAIGNLEPVTPISPASGWLDSDVPLPAVGAAPQEDPLKVEQADLFEAPPLVESSDIFSTGAAPPAKSIDGSDVLNATAFDKSGPSEPGPGGRLSDVALSFDLPAGGSTIKSAAGSGELPVAEEVIDPLFDSARHSALAAKDDAADLGSTPEETDDTSSILADLSDPGNITIEDSSAIRLEAPGIGPTHSSRPSSGTEFDLTIGEGEIPPEIAAAAAAAEGQLSKTGLRRPKSDPEQQTTPELNLDEGRVFPVDLRLRPDDPSSIFDSINDPVVFRKPGQTTPSADDEDAAVEFTDHPDDEESASDSSLFGRTSPNPRRSMRPASSHDFELPAEPASGDSGLLDWAPAQQEQDSRGETSNILKSGGKGSKPQIDPPDPDAATHAAPSLSPTARGLTSPAPAMEDSATREGVEVDWVAGSSAEQSPVEVSELERTPSRRKEKARDMERPTRPARKAPSSRAANILAGMLIATTASAAVYFSGIIPNSQKAVTKAPTPVQPGTGAPGGGTPGSQQPADGVPGQSKLFAKIQELGQLNAAVASAEDADLKAAREELQAVAKDPEMAKTAEGQRKAVEATIYLGVSYEIAGDLPAARTVYQDAIKSFPVYRDTFQAALDRLEATSAKSNGVSLRLAPEQVEQLLLAIVLLQEPPAGKEEPEAGVYFWKAVKAAGENKYADAIQLIGQAKAAHVKQARAAAGRGINPLSDPLQQIFPRSCDDLQSYWELRSAIYSHKAVADLFKKDGAAKGLAELERRAGEAVKIMADLKDARDQLTKAKADLKDAATRVAKAESELKTSRGEITKLEKTVTSARELQLAVEKKLKVEGAARVDAEAARREGDRLVAALAKELQSAKLLPDKFDNAALLAAQKSVIMRATGPTLTALLPTGMMAVGGGGLSAGQLADIAERLTKAEAAAKVADTKLSTETKKLRDSHAAEVKKLTDGYAAETKKLMDSYATDATKLKDDHAAEVKKMADKFAADSKKLTATFETKVKELELAVTMEKAAAAAMAAKFKVDLGNALSPAESLDMWLPLLTDLRRPTDAEPALATATKVIATSPPNSEDSAKGRTVAGMAHFIKGEMGKAREMFAAAQASPAYRAAAGKSWAKAAEVGLLSIDDPLAQYRRPVEALKRDPKSAARFLDTGVKAYKSGKYAEAAAALAESVKADDRDPVAWYYLGAARWESDGRDRGNDAFKQGAERERVSPLPVRMIDDLLGPIQGSARNALTAARP